MRALFFLAVLVTTSGAFPAYTQQSQQIGSLSGRVVDYRSGEPLRAGVVGAEPLHGDGPRLRPRYASLDSAGAFRFDSLRAGPWLLRVAAIAVHGGGWEVVHVRAGEETVEEVAAMPRRFSLRERDAVRAQLSEARSRWWEFEPERYEYVFRIGCGCFQHPGPWRVQVQHDSAFVRSGPGGEPFPFLMSVPRIFDWIDEALADPSRIVQVRFHPRHGYPVYVHTDTDDLGLHGWLELRIKRVQKLQTEDAGGSS